MKRTIASLLAFATSAALVVPMAFPNVVAGCDDAGYHFIVTAGLGTVKPDLRDGAKAKFCQVAKYKKPA